MGNNGLHGFPVQHPAKKHPILPTANIKLKAIIQLFNKSQSNTNNKSIRGKIPINADKEKLPRHLVHKSGCNNMVNINAKKIVNVFSFNNDNPKKDPNPPKNP